MCESEKTYFHACVLETLAILGFLAFFLWLIFHVKSPSYTIVDITIPKSSLENGGQNGYIVYALEIKNCNTYYSIYYDTSLLTFNYGQDKVAEKTIPPFHQGTGRSRRRTVIDYMDANPKVWRAVRNSISNATAELKVTLLTRIRYNTWGSKRHHVLDLQGLLPIGKDGKLSGKKKKIKLRYASKKLRTNSLRY
ncbi:uncharacterized protein LOC133729839 [Rosa rugosa]|uniref:uncharacterized protein LOC133729839 n=1 Tax=Rosa rugosa TaxID=74645 RepID=UPI002B403AE1|nr:uncharacterized protein LOC133729839 [Rosa rugosa]